MCAWATAVTDAGDRSFGLLTNGIWQPVLLLQGLPPIDRSGLSVCADVLIFLRRKIWTWPVIQRVNSQFMAHPSAINDLRPSFPHRGCSVAVMRLTPDAGTGYSPPSVRDICHVLFRHRRKSMVVFWGAVAIVIAVTIFLPRKYSSEARLFVRLGRESVALDPTATMGKTIDVDTTRAGEIRSVLDVLKSRILVERVVDKLGPEHVLGGTGNDGVLRACLRPLLGLPKLTTREKAITDVRDRIDVEVHKDSSVLSVTCRSGSPRRAQEIVATLVDVFLEEHARLHRTEKSHDFFARQTELVKQELATATQRLREAKNSAAVGSITGRQKTLESEFHETETERLRTEHALAAAAERVASLRRALATLPEELVVHEQVNGLANAGADYMRQQLYELEIRERELRSKFTDDDPQVIVVREQLDAARRIFDSQEQSRTQSVRTTNPVRQDLQLSLFRELTQVDALQAKLLVLGRQHAALRNRIEELNQHEVAVAQLERQATELESNYKTYLAKLEQSRIDQALLGEQITNVNLVQPASLSDNPISPQVKLTLLLGLLMAGAGAVGTAFVAEYLDYSLSTPEDAEAALQIPILAALPVAQTQPIGMN